MINIKSNKFVTALGNLALKVLPNKEKDDKLRQPIFPWGENNQFPYELDEKIKNSDSIESGLQTLTELAYGLGIQPYKEVVVDGEISIEPIVSGPVVEWLEENNIGEEYLEKAFYNFFRYGNVFPQLGFSKDGKCNLLVATDTPFCRMERVDPSTRTIKNIHVSDQWQTNCLKNAADFDKLKNYLKKVPLINKNDWKTSIAELSKSNNLLMWHIGDYTPGTRYYADAPWFPLLNNGIVDTDKYTGQKMKAYYDKAMNLIYHIEINQDYIVQKCDGDNSIENQEKVLSEIHESIDDNLVGAENAFSSIITTFYKSIGGDPVSNVKINVLENPINNSTVIKDMQSIAARINSALRIDDAIINAKTSGSFEADSGSEKKNAMNSHNARMALLRHKILFPLTIIKHVNKWDQNIKFGIKTTEIKSLDKNPTGSQQKLN